MPEYHWPGVYVEEQAAGPAPITGVATSTTGFVGRTERGPTRPRLVTSWGAYERVFGGVGAGVGGGAGGASPVGPLLTPLAVRGFFENGGGRAVIARVASATAAAASIDLATDAGAGHTWRVVAIGPGAWGNRLRVRVEPATNADHAADPPRDWVRVTITLYAQADGAGVPLAEEVFDDLDPSDASASTNTLVSRITASSDLVRIEAVGVPGRPNDVAAADGALTGGVDGDPIAATDFVGDGAAPPESRTGLAALAPEAATGGPAAPSEVQIVTIPEHVDPSLADRAAITQALVAHAEASRDRVAILSIESGQDDVGTIVPPCDSSFAAVYTPWLRVEPAPGAAPVLVPPVGHVAGIYARTDRDRGVHTAPANEVVVGLAGAAAGTGGDPLEFAFTNAQQDVLNPRHVNVIRDFRSSLRGIRVWGARTTSSDPEWRYVNIRRLMNFLEVSIQRGTQWAVFEPNTIGTWVSVRGMIADFLDGLWRSGALMGSSPKDASFVRCDETTMTQADLDHGRMIVLIGVAPAKPAEFVIFRIGQRTADAPA